MWEERGQFINIRIEPGRAYLNPHIEDVARRTALAGFLAFAPDALTPLGGYPGNDDDGRALQRQRDRAEMTEDSVAAVTFLQSHAECSGRVGAVGFCFGGGMVNTLAVRIPDLAAGVPFYGGQPPAEDVPNIKAPLLLHYAGLDERINRGWPAYEAASLARNAGKRFPPPRVVTWVADWVRLCWG